MGGKGRRRREKNYQAAHGGAHVGLPPPPDRSILDAVPAKLRKIMSYTGSEIGKPASRGADNKIGDRSRATEKKLHSEDKVRSEITVIGEDGENQTSEYLDDEEEDTQDTQNQSTMGEKKKKKRKRKLVSDLRFEQLDLLTGTSSKRKERRKLRSEERKKKLKKTSQDENVGFQAQDKVKFGEVVEAPPKLSVPKAFKTAAMDASQERLRLQAIEAYRERKGWTSRLGTRLPISATLSEDLQLS